MIALMGININCRQQDYTGQILRGEKLIETRRTQSLRPYVGQRVGIVRTGLGQATLVGYATVGEPIWYGTVEQFRGDEGRHMVAAGSVHDWAPGGKFGFPLLDVEPCGPRVLTSRGIVARKLST